MELQDYHSSKNRIKKQQDNLHLKKSSILGLFFVILWLVPTIRWRFQAGSFSFALLEPFVLLITIILFIARNKIKLSINLFTIFLLAFIAWLIAIRPWGPDFEHGLSDIRDWIIPIFAFIVLYSTVKHGWRTWALISIGVGILQAGLGIFQVFTNGFRPFVSSNSVYKLDFLSNVPPSFSVGFFEHPNSLAVFLCVAMIVLVGWIAESRRTMRFGLVVLFVFFSLALYWTYAKAEILSLILMIFFFNLIFIIKSSRLFLILGLFAFISVFVVGWFAINQWPYEFGSIWWRINLWQSALQTFTAYPGILLWGNGDVLFAANSIWPQPHNILFDALIKYGVIGLLIQLILFSLIIYLGINSYERGDFKKSLLLRAIWVSLIGFLFAGIVESSFLSIETRMLFLLLSACFLGFRREIEQVEQSKPSPVVAGNETYGGLG